MRYIDIWQNDTGVWKLVAADLIQLAPTQFSYAYQVTKFTMANGTTTVYPGPGRTDTMTLSLECTQEQCINLLYATQNSPVLTIANMRSEIGEASSSLKYCRFGIHFLDLVPVATVYRYNSAAIFRHAAKQGSNPLCVPIIRLARHVSAKRRTQKTGRRKVFARRHLHHAGCFCQ